MTSRSQATPLPPDKLELLQRALNSPPPTRDQINDLRARVLNDEPLTPEEYYSVLHVEATLAGSLMVGDENKPKAGGKRGGGKGTATAVDPASLLDIDIG